MVNFWQRLLKGLILVSYMLNIFVSNLLGLRTNELSRRLDLS